MTKTTVPTEPRVGFGEREIFGACLQLEDSSDVDEPAKTPFERGQWRPGKNCGKFAPDFNAPLARVLIGHICSWPGRLRAAAVDERRDGRAVGHLGGPHPLRGTLRGTLLDGAGVTGE